MKIMLDDGAIMPTKAHKTDAGYDLYANERTHLYGHGCCIVDTGVHIAIPEGFYGLVAGRSGLNFKEDIICPQGTIDSGYTGSIKVKLYNMGLAAKTIQKGDRIAQIIFMRCESPVFERTESMDETDRGSGGFGSSGT